MSVFFFLFYTMICAFCDECTYNQFKEHEVDIIEACGDAFSKDDFMCSICLGLVYQPFITDSWHFRVICKACIPKIMHRAIRPKYFLPNYPLNNQLNTFLEKANLKTNKSSNYGEGIEVAKNNDLLTREEYMLTISALEYF